MPISVVLHNLGMSCLRTNNNIQIGPYSASVKGARFGAPKRRGGEVWRGGFPSTGTPGGVDGSGQGVVPLPRVFIFWFKTGHFSSKMFCVQAKGGDIAPCRQP